MLLCDKQLFLLKQKIDRMIDLLKIYDVVESAKFKQILIMLVNNIEKCIKYDFDGIKELSRYVYEDWKCVCLGKNGIEKWYFNIEDLNLKWEINKTFEEIACSVDEILGTNFIVKRKWYSYDELISLGKQYKERENEWNKVINKLISNDRYYVSPIKFIPSDIWSFAKMLSLADTDDLLKEWFSKDIIEFGYLSPKKIVQIENGDDILRNFMYDIPV